MMRFWRDWSLSRLAGKSERKGEEVKGETHNPKVVSSSLTPATTIKSLEP